MKLLARMVGSSKNRLDDKGVAPMESPAKTVTVWFLYWVFLSRTILASAAAPPAYLPYSVPGVRPSRCPWRSL